ncbi:MAG TPA: tRNA pseudouridine(13) synthase TruD [Myxococcota bacterium]|nr:tRNA pseudouridine(13) synthase TruD [Myxococcota bacterium]
MISTRWPPLLGDPPTSGVIRNQPEDFVVTEIPAYLPSGSGEHLFVFIEKRDLTTERVVQALADQLGMSPREVGTAGLKDRRAVTRQWFSVPRTAGEHLSSFDLDGARVIESGLHGNKLKTGHLKGNNFRILVRDVDPGAWPEIERRSIRLLAGGVPNYYGPQRFGRDGRNEQIGLELLCGKRRQGRGRTLRLLLSAAQSALFNDVLARRIERELFGRALAGDVMVKADSGGIFTCDDPQLDQARMDAFEIHPTGPMFGPHMRTPQGEALAMESRVLESAGLGPDDFLRYGKLTRGTRRPLRIVPAGLAVANAPAGIELSFDLPAGAYATSVLAEFFDYREASR